MSSLELALLYLLAAVLCVAACRWLKLPSILGYLVAGVLMEPHTLGLAFGQDAESIRELAEYGVVFLMFVIGLEFNLSRLRSMRRHVFGLGLAQVAGTMLIATLVTSLLAWWLPDNWDITWKTALVVSGALAMSSTAIVARMMADRLELASEHGQRVLGVLLLQDLAVVPLLILVPALGALSENLWLDLAVALFKAGVLIALVLWGGPRVMRWWLTIVARRKSQELSMLNLLLLTLGMAWLTQQAGLSLALGAFICGVLISETEFKLQVEAEIRPFHDVLLGLFFITIGMLLDWRLVLWRLPLVLLILAGFVLFKLVLVSGLARLWGASTGVALRTGLYLAQAGEFGFVLLTLSRRSGLVPLDLFQPVLAAMVLSMLATPFIVMASERIVVRLVANEWLQMALQATNIARQAIDTRDHVLICGYGRSGQSLARILDQQGIPYMALDLDPDLVRQGTEAGHAVVFGDATKAHALAAAGLGRASTVALTYLDPRAVEKTLAMIRAQAPQVPVIVRTKTDRDLDALRAAGATEVVPEEVEGALLMAGHALALMGTPMLRVMHVLRDYRDARYRLMRGYFRGAIDGDEENPEAVRLATLFVPERLAGYSLGEILAQVLGGAGDRAHAVSVRRHKGQSVNPVDDLLLDGNDALVLSGPADALAAAEQALSKM
ncbi:MAG: potassium transporter [Burkholderiaceae bacterium]|nr:MAG: potassium transporter [Burkholderiaceae bacterium]